jgi:hypothetical protein
VLLPLHLAASDYIIAIVPEIVICVDEFFTLFFLFLVFVKLLGLSFLLFVLFFLLFLFNIFLLLSFCILPVYLDFAIFWGSPQ